MVPLSEDMEKEENEKSIASQPNQASLESEPRKQFQELSKAEKIFSQSVNHHIQSYISHSQTVSDQFLKQKSDLEREKLQQSANTLQIKQQLQRQIAILNGVLMSSFNLDRPLGQNNHHSKEIQEVVRLKSQYERVLEQINVELSTEQKDQLKSITNQTKNLARITENQKQSSLKSDSQLPFQRQSCQSSQQQSSPSSLKETDRGIENLNSSQNFVELQPSFQLLSRADSSASEQSELRKCNEQKSSMVGKINKRAHLNFNFDCRAVEICSFKTLEVVMVLLVVLALIKIFTFE